MTDEAKNGYHITHHLFIQDAVKDKNEGALKTVEDRENVREHDSLLADECKTKRPRQTKQNFQHKRTFYPRPRNSWATDKLLLQRITSYTWKHQQLKRCSTVNTKYTPLHINVHTNAVLVEFGSLDKMAWKIKVGLIGKGKGQRFYIAFIFCSIHARRSDMDTWITQFYLKLHRCLTLGHKRSPDGAFPDWGCGHLIGAYYSFIYLERMKGWLSQLGWLTYSGPCGRYTHKWSPISCRSSAGLRKFAGQRPTSYHCTTRPTSTDIDSLVHKYSVVFRSPFFLCLFGAFR